MLTSRPRQLIGERSRFEASWAAGERASERGRDRGGIPEQRRAARGGTGEPDTQSGPFFCLFLQVKTFTPECQAVRGGSCLGETSRAVRKKLIES